MSTDLGLTEALALANSHYAVGRLREADRVIDSICEALPDAAIRTQLRFQVALQRSSWSAAYELAEQICAFPDADDTVWMSLGAFMVERGAFEWAVRTFRRMLEQRPAYPEAHFNLAHALLALGDYAAAWPEFEWRYRLSQASGFIETDPQQLWDGRLSTERCLLVETEQGFGDSIQFLRYLPWAASRCGRLLVKCRKPLVRLVEWMGVEATVFTSADPVPAEFDAYCPAGRLAGLQGATANTVLNQCPYVKVPSLVLDEWAQKLACIEDGTETATSGPRVGLVWAGNPKNATDRKRSMHGDALRPLLDLPARFYNLQVGAAAAQLRDAGGGLLEVQPDLRDFGDTAAVMSLLDEIVTVETSVSHLAAALGIDAMVLLARVPDWRYTHLGARARWFPSLSFFSEDHSGDWGPPVTRVRAALAGRLARRAAY